jgi:hypothetical protein
MIQCFLKINYSNNENVAIGELSKFCVLQIFMGNVDPEWFIQVSDPDPPFQAYPKTQQS